MVYIINLVTSSSPGASIKLNSSPTAHRSPKEENGKRSKIDQLNNLNSPSNFNKASSLCQSFSTIPRYFSDQEDNEDIEIIKEIKFDNEAFQKFKNEWQKHQEINSNSELEVEAEIVETKNNLNLMHEIKNRRASDSFRITPIVDPTITIIKNTNQKNNYNQNHSHCNSQRKFKNKMEAISSIRLFLSNSMIEAYEPELRRRFNERPSMSECVALDSGLENVRISSESGSFRWKFVGRDEFLAPRLFVLNSEILWDEFIASRNYEELLRAYNEANIYLYFINWKRAAQKHTSLLNKQFKEAVVNDGLLKERLVPVNELENEFFLAAAGLRLQVNFSGASSGPQAMADLMDFVIEMTRVVAQDAYLKESAQGRENSLNLTLTRDVKIKSGKDPRDCWIKVLCQIPRVTVPLAAVIVARYPSFSALMEAFDCCDRPEELLSELKLDDRRIGPVLSARIYNYFYRFN